jgi:hypothetical protein
MDQETVLTAQAVYAEYQALEEQWAEGMAAITEGGAGFILRPPGVESRLVIVTDDPRDEALVAETARLNDLLHRLDTKEAEFESFPAALRQQVKKAAP